MSADPDRSVPVEPLPEGLRRFFSAFTPMLELKSGAADVEATLGASPTGTRRLGFYGVMARRNRFLALRQLCPATRHAALALRPSAWDAIVMGYSAEHPPSHPDPSRFAERLSDFIAAERERGLPLPAYLEELADYEYTEWLVGVIDFEPSRADPGLGRTVCVRHYAYDVQSFVTAFRCGEAPSAPVERPHALLVYRHAHTQRAHAFYPTPLGLAALARRAGRELTLPHGMDASLDDAERELERQGILP